MSKTRPVRRRAAQTQSAEHEAVVFREGADAYYAGQSINDCKYFGLDAEIWREGWTSSFEASGAPRTRAAGE